jgi:hypothetical protein
MPEIIYSDKVDKESVRVQIFKSQTGTKGFEVVECFHAGPDLHKLKLVIWETVRGGGAGSARGDVVHYVDVIDFKAIARAVMQRFSPLAPAPQPAPPTELWTDMKGTPQPDGSLQARILTLTYAPAKDYPFEIVIKNGPGRLIGKGAVAMNGKATGDILFSFSRLDFVAMCGEVLDWVHDWEVRHLGDRRDARTIVLRPKK